MKLNKQLHAKIHLLLLMLIAFFLPLAHYVPILIACLLVNWILEGDFQSKFKAIFTSKISLLFVSFYLLYLFGLLYTKNFTYAFADIGIKLSLFLFPILLSSKPVNKAELQKVLFSLTVGCLVSLAIMLTRASLIYNSTGENNFYYQALSPFIHPSYISMYMNLCTGWIFIHFLHEEHKSQFILSNLVSIIIVAFFSIMIIFLSSKLGFISLLLLFFIFLLQLIFKRKNYFLGIMGILVIAFSILGIWFFVPEFKGRIERGISALTAKNTDQSESESSAVRILIWKASEKVIQENLIFGTGTGDPKDELFKEYRNRGMTGAIEHNLNAHNQFIQTTITLGIIGLAVFLVYLFVPLYFSWKQGNYLFVLFTLLICINFLTESMLETEAGVIFIAFFQSLLYFKTTKENNNFVKNI